MAVGLLQTLHPRGNKHDLKGQPYERIVPTGDECWDDPEEVAGAEQTCIANSLHSFYFSEPSTIP